MRVEIIRCDRCKKEHNTEYILPSEWFLVKQWDTFTNETERHFCSDECLMKWVTDRVIQVERYQVDEE